MFKRAGGMDCRRNRSPSSAISLTKSFERGLVSWFERVCESRCVAAAIFFQFGRKAIYKFGASEAASLQARGNNLVMWEGIRFLARSGCESLHFGRTSLANAGLRRFKLGWGTTEELIRYFKWDTATGKWGGGCDHGRGLHNAFFAKMPLAINRLAGALLYPHLD